MPPSSTTTTEAVPAGPTPGPVRNVTVTKTTLGVRITWNPPADASTIPISHYIIEYKFDGPKWLHWGPIKDTTVYEGKYTYFLQRIINKYLYNFYSHYTKLLLRILIIS